MLKRQCNTTMTVQKRTYKVIIKWLTDPLVNWTGRHASRPEEVLFFADAHLVHCLLPATAQSQTKWQKSKSQILPTLYYTIKMA